MMKMHRYQIDFFNFHSGTADAEIVKAYSAEDAFFVWDKTAEASCKHFNKITCLEDIDETGSPER